MTLNSRRTLPPWMMKSIDRTEVAVDVPECDMCVNTEDLHPCDDCERSVCGDCRNKCDECTHPYCVECLTICEGEFCQRGPFGLCSTCVIICRVCGDNMCHDCIADDEGRACEHCIKYQLLENNVHTYLEQTSNVNGSSFPISRSTEDL